MEGKDVYGVSNNKITHESEDSEDCQRNETSIMAEESLTMEFFRRFSKPLLETNFKDLRQAVLQLVSESVANKREIRDLKQHIYLEGQILEGYKQQLKLQEQLFEEFKRKSELTSQDCAKLPGSINEECMLEEMPNMPGTRQANDVVENTAVSHSPNSARNANTVVYDLELPKARENQIEKPMDFDDTDSSESQRKKLQPLDEFLNDTDSQAVNDGRNTEKDENECVGGVLNESASKGSKEGQVGNSSKMKTGSLRAEFLKRFSKPINQMNRYDLEQLVLQKVSESIMYKSEVADLRRQISRQEQMLQGLRRKMMYMISHYDDLKTVTEYAVRDLKKRANSFVAPVKITRAVGLQTPELFNQGVLHLFRLAQKNPIEASSPIDISTRQKFKKRSRDATPKSMSNVGSQRQVSAKQNRQSIPGNLPPLNAIKTTSSITNSPALNGMVRANKSHGARSLNGVPVVNSTTNASSRVAVPPINKNVITTTPTHTATANNTIVNSNSNSESNFNTSGSDDSVRRRSLHKITPMRPYLSPYQQAQQEKQVRQHQEFLVQIIHQQNQQAQRKAQLNAQQDHLTGGNTASRNSTEGGTPRQRPAFNMPPGRLVTGAVQSSNTQATTGCPSRTSSSVVSSTTPTAVSRSKSANTTVSPSPVDSLIDLTDEDESTRNAEGVVTSKRPKLTANGTQTLASSTHLTPGSTAAVASNQLVRLTQGAMRPQQQVSTTDGAVPAAMNATATVVYQHNGSVVRTTVPKRPAATICHPTGMAGQANQRPRVPSPDVQGLMKKRVRTKSPSQINSVLVPLPSPEPQPSNSMWKLSPPQPTICVNNLPTGIVISWSMPTLGDQHEVIYNYQIYAHQESNSGGMDEWQYVCNVPAIGPQMLANLPPQFQGQRYHFAVRAIDVRMRVGAFSEPRTWNDTKVSNN
ncbi:activating transcription factor 7-interacting protein 1-like [Anopheles nili]|uniref:activating transcription factor 7-interacting protein 1-like n=1 Tax=Anopheles nili TaxID=185578 RepID=UPI00237AD038|nr:activating transcription factor 7-interacting protein 1-like [Anopheles nili]